MTSNRNVDYRLVSSLLLCAFILLGPIRGSLAASVNLTTAPLVTPTNAWSYYGTATTHTIGVAAPTTTPPEIMEIARALGAGRYSNTAYATAVYEYVRNNIANDFRFGLSKGARGALIDQSGTAFDQAQLMVALLRQGNVSATYQGGTISVTASQFGLWTGLVTGLVENTQTFSVQAQAACQFLADGGIPAAINGSTSCTGLTGNLSTSGTPVVMAHVWVLANGTIYDPAFKLNVLKTGFNLAQSIGCGTQAAPTCGSTIYNLVPAPTTVSGTTNLQMIQSVPQSTIETQLKAYGTALETAVKSYNATNFTNALVQDLVGGMLIDLTQPTTAGSLLPLSAYSTPQYAWTGDIPDQISDHPYYQI